VELPAHAAFIIAAYLVTILVVVGLIAWVLADYRAQQRDLADLEARGHGRKSGSSLGSKA
jgi:heme exporter protein D